MTPSSSFDECDDNAGGILKSGDLSYGEMVNLSMNRHCAFDNVTRGDPSVLSVLLVAPTSRWRRRSRATTRASSSSHERGLLLDLHRESVARVDERTRNRESVRWPNAHDCAVTNRYSRRPPRHCSPATAAQRLTRSSASIRNPSAYVSRHALAWHHPGTRAATKTAIGPIRLALLAQS